MNYIKNGSTPTLMVLLVDQTDGQTAESSLTLADIDAYISKNGGTFAAAANTGAGMTNVGRGWYSIALTATETNTDGELVIEVEDPANSRTWRKVYQVMTNALTDQDMDDNADHVLRRNFSNARSGNGDTLSTSTERYTLIGMAGRLNHIQSLAGSTLTIKREDGTTDAYSLTVETNAAADPITGITA